MLCGLCKTSYASDYSGENIEAIAIQAIIIALNLQVLHMPLTITKVIEYQIQAQD